VNILLEIFSGRVKLGKRGIASAKVVGFYFKTNIYSMTHPLQELIIRLCIPW
jgi:hypothetical protein